MTTSRQTLILAATLLLAGVAALPLLAEPGLLNSRGGGDSPFLLQRLHQLETAVADGHFPARWMPDANYGYGYPFYNFYAPLSIYIALLFRVVGFSYVHAIEMAQLAGFLTAAVGMFALAKRWFQNGWAALLTAVAYTMAPFHLVNVYVRGDSLAEFWAMAFYPFIILAVDDLVAPPTGRYGRGAAIARFSLAYAALILSHNISALIFSPFILLYGGLRFLATAKTHTAVAHLKAEISPFLFGLLLAFFLAAWFFVPALAEKGAVQLDIVTEGYFHFSNHFLGQAQRPLLQQSFFFDYAVDHRQAFRMGLWQTVALLAGTAVLLGSWRQTAPLRPHHRLFVLATLLISTCMLLPLSRPLWQHVPLLSFTQFPWRFLSVQAFAGALATGALALLPWRRWLVPAMAALLTFTAVGQLPHDTLLLSDADVTAEKLAQYEWFSGNIGTTISAEYLPTSVQPRMVTSAWLNSGQRWLVRALSGQLQQATLQQAETDYQQWLIDTAVPSQLQFPTLYWAGWQAWVDGQPVPLRPSPGSGLFLLELDQGSHTVEFRLQRSPLRLVAEYASLLALLLALWLLWPGVRLGLNWRNLAGLTAVGVLLWLLARLWPQPTVVADDLTWDFAQMAYLHHDSDGVAYNNGLRLQSYQYEAENIVAGQLFRIHTVWQGGDGQATLRLVTPATNRYSQPAPPVIAQDSQPIRNGRATFDLHIPADAPVGLFLPQLQLAAGQPLMASGQPRGDLFLRPLPLHNSQTLPPAAKAIEVRALQVTPRPSQPHWLDIDLAWWTAVPLSHNYNVALRLTDAHGRFLQLADAQPGYGFQPSSLWTAASWNYDRLAMLLPPDAHALPYRLMVQLYDVANPQTAVLTRRLGEIWLADTGATFVPNQPLFSLPAAPREAVTAVFDQQIQLHGYHLQQMAHAVQLRLDWQAVADGTAEYTRFVHLVPVGQLQPVAQDDNLPQQGTYPTSQWVAGEFVADTAELSLAGLPAGDYQLLVGFYQTGADGRTYRATAVDTQDYFLLPTTVTIP